MSENNQFLSKYIRVTERYEFGLDYKLKKTVNVEYSDI